MVAIVVIVGNESFNLLLQVTRNKVIFKQDAVLEGLMPSLDLTLCLRMIWSPSDMIYAVFIEPIGQFPGDIAGTIV